MTIDTILYNPTEEETIRAKYHTVRTIQAELGRSRSWAYMIISMYRPVYLQNAVTGVRERACHRNLVKRYLATHQRGNPNWLT